MSKLSGLQWKKFPVLSDGFVCLVDVMGDDSSIVQAARVSYEGEGSLNEERTPEQDRGLIRYLMRHRHTTPFEMAELKFLVRVPMDCWRQWIRHRTANVNEYSTRYTKAIDSMDVTAPDSWRAQSKTNKQGSSDSEIHWPANSESRITGITPGEYLSGQEKGLLETSREIYEQRLAMGVAREQARKDLPLSTYTEAYWKIDLHNLLHFLSLRMHSHAQKEIRDYAMTIGFEIVAPLFPLVWEAFEDYRLNGMFLTGPDIKIFVEKIMGLAGMGTPDFKIEDVIPNKREAEECLAKLKRFGLDIA